VVAVPSRGQVCGYAAAGEASDSNAAARLSASQEVGKGAKFLVWGNATLQKLRAGARAGTLWRNVDLLLWLTEFKPLQELRNSISQAIFTREEP
jgi:hypothetical protein